MKVTQLLVIVILLLIITILIIVSSQTQKNITISKKIDIPKIVIPKVTIPQTDINPKEDELSQIASNLEKIIEEDNETTKKIKPTEDEVQDILSNLEELKPIEEPKTITRKKPRKRPKRDKKKRIAKKREIVKKQKVVKKVEPKEIIIYKEIIVEKPIVKKEHIITAEEYRRRLAKESQIDKELASLSMVKTVDMDIEQKIKEGKAKELRTPKPIVEQKTIYIPPSSKYKVDEKIPWAELKEMNEKVDGILIKESINY